MTNHSIPKGLIIEAAFLIYAIALLAHWGETEYVRTLSVTFVSIVLEAFPFMLIGSVIGGLIEEFVSEEKISSILPEGKLRTVFVAAGMGMIFPVCECAVVPVVRRLLRKGAPFPAAIAFLLGGPIVNPVVFASTAVAYRLDWGVCAIRLIAGYFIAVGIGLSMGMLFRKGSAVLPEVDLTSNHMHKVCCGHNHMAGGLSGSRVVSAFTHAAHDFLDITGFLVMGAFIAALLQSSVDRTSFLFFAEYPSASIILMMSLAVVLNLCSEADAFVAASFRFLVPLSGQMAFMVLGPMLDLKLVFMYTRVFRKGAIIVLAGMTVFTVFMAMVVLHGFVGWGY